MAEQRDLAYKSLLEIEEATGNEVINVLVETADGARKVEKKSLAASSVGTGWASYIDTQYPDSDNVFTLTANVDTVMPNNAGVVLDGQKPEDVTTFYDSTTQKITGRNGDNLDAMMYFKAIPTYQNQWLDIWVDIGGSVGELYRQTFTFPKGIGVSRGILYALPSAYTLDTWQANGGSLYIRSNFSLDVYQINYNFDRSHKART